MRTIDRYVKKKTLQDRFDVSRSFVNDILSEMRDVNLYGQFLITDKSFLRVNERAFEHYLRNRHAIKRGGRHEPYKLEGKQ